MNLKPVQSIKIRLFAIQMRSYLACILAISLSLVLFTQLGGCSGEEGLDSQPGTFLNHHDSVEYVGSEVCKNCHTSIYTSFMKTGMGQSFDEATRQKSSTDFNHEPLYDSFSNFYYRPFWNKDSLFLLEYRLDENGDTLHARRERVDYIVGSGQHTNSHIQNRNGYLHQLPFTYYTQKGILNLPPGFEKGNNSRFSRDLGLECISCHNSFPDMTEKSTIKFANMPQGIGCERCHGPGELHVQQKLAGDIVDTKTETDYSIVNPAKLSFEKQTDLCMRCHLQGNALLKDGKEWTDFKPGMDLKDYINVFMPVLSDQKGAFIMAAHPDRLRQSACFIKSQTDDPKATALTCITCHNPHLSVHETSSSVFIETCNSCHEEHQVNKCPKATVDANCLDCHMQKSGTVDIPHVSVTDHFIRVYVEDSVGEESVNPQEFVGLICLTQDQASPALKAKAYLNFYEKFDRKKPFLDSAKKFLAEIKIEEHPSAFVQYYFLTGVSDKIISSLDKIKVNQLTHRALYQVAHAYGQRENYAEQRHFLLKAVAKQPHLLSYRLELAQVYLRLGDLSKGDKEISFILKEDPKNAEAYNLKGFSFLLQGEIIEAQVNFKKVLKLNPDHSNAMLNLAKVYIAKNNEKEVRYWIQRVLEVDKNSKEAKYLLRQLEK